MSLTLEEIQARIASIIDQDYSAPDTTGDDWSLRKLYINMAQDEWAQLYNWPSLYREYSTMTSTGTSNVTVSLPSNFRNIAGFPKASFSGSTFEFEQVAPQQKTQKSASDLFFYRIGDTNSGNYVVFNPGIASGQFPSGASIFISYYSVPNSLVSPADISPVPDPQYLVKRSVALLLESREDPRFPSAKVEAEKILQRMLKRELTPTEADNDLSRVRTVEETRYGFRIGRD